ncbi:hypothetical protein BDY24DRAFT_417492 [Mrakia frigida]|uniref:uncharacterized protein n=1 Tax=Mrakia frigida TaxID=29902 RepID=UPI003FCC26A1
MVCSSAPPILHHLSFLFLKSSVSLSLPPLALTDLNPLPTTTDEFRVCKRVETKEPDVYAYRPVGSMGNLREKSMVWDTFFLQFKDSETDEWLDVDVTPPALEEDEEEEEEIPVPSLGGDESAGGGSKGKGKGRAYD